jgi:hypothetical protein
VEVGREEASGQSESYEKEDAAWGFDGDGIREEEAPACGGVGVGLV